MEYFGMTGLFLSAFVIGAILTWKIRSLALRRGILDVPNERSSHVTPTPRGGGLSFVVLTLTFAALAPIWGGLPVIVSLATLLGGGIVAGIGLLDDLFDLGARIRLFAHALAAVAVVICLGPLHEIPVFFTAIQLGVMGWPFTVILIIWLINLTNFMDGINGISSVHAIGFCVAAMLVGSSSGVVSLALVLSGAVSGFMLWNFPKARIFMGDAGSGFLGVGAAIFLLAPTVPSQQNTSVVMIALAPFVTDATLTLFFRLSKGERMSQAHRLHLYQRLSRIANGHTPVTVSFAAVLFGIMGPLAVWAAGVFGPVAAGIPLWTAYLICFAIWLGAIRPVIALDTLH